MWLDENVGIIEEAMFYFKFAGSGEWLGTFLNTHSRVNNQEVDERSTGNAQVEISETW